MLCCGSSIRNWGIVVFCCIVVASLLIWSGFPRADGSNQGLEGSVVVEAGLGATSPRVQSPGEAAGIAAQRERTREEKSRQWVLITGANRGLGLEFARQFAAAGYNVIGTARTPAEASDLRVIDRVRVVQLDVTDPNSIERLGEELSGQRIDILINNAGVGGWTQSIRELDGAHIAQVINVNTIGPMRMVASLYENLKDGERKTIVNISSGMGSIANNASGGSYGYRESKAAINMFTRSLASELKNEGFTCIVLSPGWVKTDMGGEEAQLTPEESIRGMIQVIEALTREDSGKFLSWKGEQVPW